MCYHQLKHFVDKLLHVSYLSYGRDRKWIALSGVHPHDHRIVLNG